MRLNAPPLESNGGKLANRAFYIGRETNRRGKKLSISAIEFYTLV
jgi:hypothetical protein